MGEVLAFRPAAPVTKVSLDEAEEELRARRQSEQATKRRVAELLLDVEVSLSREHRRVLELKYGIEGVGPCDAMEIGVLMDLETARIMSLLGEAIHFAGGMEAARKAA